MARNTELEFNDNQPSGDRKGPTNIQSLFVPFQQKLAGIDTPMQRAVLFAEWISQIDAEQASVAFSAICVHPSLSKAADDILLAESAFLSLLEHHWPGEHLAYTRQAAAYHDQEITLAFLQYPADVDDTEEHLLVPKYTSERVLTLGERKALAAQPSRRKIEMALMDPHPDVATKLLDNPKLTEADVVRVSAKSTMAPSVLAKIAAHPKWRRQRTVQKALVNNRLLPKDYALTLIPFLQRAVIREIARDNRLHESVQHAAGLLADAVSKARTAAD
ncbi:MAG: hypothetical protein JXX29_06075 [Deltaproteobacteria bacterium]|nr:hypothetical protein [Deltaproteobacteria bacterium]MBN2671217.1 hypothetical protein [Deltaproteobacteria bacterium]